MSENKNNPAIAGSLLLVVLLWGGNNAGTKWLVHAWPPVFTGATRFLFAGIILLAVLRFTRLLGEFQPLSPAQRRQLWWRGGLSLAAYTVVFCWALRLTAASHVALYIGASPIWALLVEPLIVAFKPGVGTWLPFNVFGQVTSSSIATDAGNAAAHSGLTRPEAFLVSVAYIAVVSVAAVVVSMSRDVT